MSDFRKVGTDRRRFVGGVGVALLAARCLPSVAHASASSPDNGNKGAGDLFIHSGPGFWGHTHDLLIPYAFLKAPPPRGVRLRSTRTLFHTHDLVLTQKQLLFVKHGGEVTAIGGSHSFVITLAHANSKETATRLQPRRGT